MPEPVRALADCVLGCNLLGTVGNIVAPIVTILLVDLRIPRCPPTPDTIARELLPLIDETAAPAG